MGKRPVRCILSMFMCLSLTNCTVQPVDSVESTTSPSAVVDAAAPPTQSETTEGAALQQSTFCRGYATRYWDCCKAPCGWAGNTPDSVSGTRSCTLSNESIPQNSERVDACDRADKDGAYACFDMRPWVVNHRLSYGFATVPRHVDACGRCYELRFSGHGQHDPNDPGSRQLGHKRMVVQAVGMSKDVGRGQFDLLIPGGGTGDRQACDRQLNVKTARLGAEFGGLLTSCHTSLGYQNHGAVKNCVRAHCAALFSKDTHAALLSGCDWFTDWFEVADNPQLTYREVMCPDELIAVSGMDRRPLKDLDACVDLMPQDGTSNRGQCKCDCQWAENRTQCGVDDGTCCWWACCGTQ